MVKKSVSKKSPSQNKKPSSEDKVNKILVENLVSLQKVLTNLSVKFDSLTKRLDGMIDLFEESAKTVVKGEINAMEDSKHTKKVLDKMDNLFEQNKLIARGLTLLNESTAGGLSEEISSSTPDNVSQKGFDASPSVQSSPYAMPYSNPSQFQNNQNNQNNQNRNMQNNSQRFRRDLDSESNPSFGGSSFDAPEPSKMSEGDNSDGNSKKKNIPSSPPFGNF